MITGRKIAIIEDNIDDQYLIGEVVGEMFPEYAVDYYTHPPQILHDLRRYWIIIVDEVLGPYRGTEIIRLMRRAGVTAQIILLTGYEYERDTYDHFCHKDRPEDLLHLLDALRQRDPIVERPRHGAGLRVYDNDHRNRLGGRGSVSDPKCVSAMKDEDYRRLRKMLRLHEGVRSHLYKCSANAWTIGVGRNLTANGISTDEIELMLTNDINRAAAEAESFDWFRGLNPPRQAAIIDLIFNLGLARFKGFRKAIAALERKDYDRASDEILDSRYAKQVGVRSIRVAGMIRHGKWGDD